MMKRVAGRLCIALAVILAVASGCNDDPAAPEFGTITISPEPSTVNAPWQITGPNAFTLSGAGALTLANMQAGTYTLTWGAVVGWIAPSPVAAAQTLAEGGALTFTGTYVVHVQSGTITIDPEPNSINAPWQIAGPNAFSRSGTGDALLTDMIEGTYVLTWGAVAGRISPVPAVVTQSLALGGAVTFSGTYEYDIPLWRNRIGIYASPDAVGTVVHPVLAASFYIYFILTNPTAGDGSPITAVKGWEYTVTVTGPEEGFVRFVDLLPPTCFNIGNADDPFNATYFAAMETPQPVSNQKITLHRWTLRLFDDSAPYYFYLSPCLDNPSIAGRMAFMDAAGHPVAADGSTDDYYVPVFSIGEFKVGAESEIVGAVRALFR